LRALANGVPRARHHLDLGPELALLGGQRLELAGEEQAVVGALDGRLNREPGAGQLRLDLSGLARGEVRAQLLAVIEALAPRFDRILLDTGAGISDVVLYAVSLAGDVVLVVTPEPASMTDAYATVKVLSSQQRRGTIRLVVNQVGRLGEGRAVRAQLQRVIDRYVNPAAEPAVSLDLLGDVPDDAAVREAVQKRQLLLEVYPGSAAAKAIGALAERLAP